jgi:hypothetical protein
MYKTVILPVVPYECKTWSLTLREEHRLRVFQNSVLMFSTKREEDRSWKKLHNDELHRWRMRWVVHVACMGEGRNVYRVLVGRPDGRRPLGRPRCRWEGNIKIDLMEIGIDGMNWIQLAQDRVQC